MIRTDFFPYERKIIMKKLLAVIICIAMLFTVVGCTEKEPAIDTTTVRLATLKGPTGVGMVKMLTDDAAKETPSYEVTLSSAPDDIKAGILSGSFDIAAIPTNLAAVLYNKAGADISVLAVNTLGVLYILENGDSIKSVNDLKGKKLYATGQASTPEYILNYILEKNGIDPKNDVEIEYMTEHAELAAQMASGAVSIGMLPEPNVTSAMITSETGSMRIALNLTEEWEKIAGGTTIMQGCVVVNNTFLKEHPQAVAKFMEQYAASVEYVKANVDEAAAMCEALGVIPKAPLAKKAIPNCNLTFVTGTEMQEKLGAFLKVLFDADPSSVGGKLPEAGFYYTGK